jgi:hypothetical protein
VRKCFRRVLKRPLPRIAVSSSSKDASCIVLLAFMLKTMMAAAGIIGNDIREKMSLPRSFRWRAGDFHKIHAHEYKSRHESSEQQRQSI